MDNLNILVEAKREYLEQLSILTCPVMIDVFDAMYQEAHKLSKGRKVLIMFQKLLRDVPEWSETMAKQHTDNIANRCAWFKDLVAAVFVSSVKILSAVRLSKDTKKLSVKLPTNEVFIHTCYKNAARDLYKDPYIFTENLSEHTRNDRLYDRFAACIEATVKELIPVQEILQTYMTMQNDEIMNPGDMDMTQDDVEEYDGSPQEPAPMEEAPMEAPMEDAGGPLSGAEDEPMEGEPTPGEDLAPQPEMKSNPLDDEFRTISTNAQGPAPQEENDEEDLFPDASETRTKKLSY